MDIELADKEFQECAAKVAKFISVSIQLKTIQLQLAL